MLETSAFESLHGAQFTLSTQLIKPNRLVILPTDAAPQFLITRTRSMHKPDLFCCSGFSVNLQVFVLLYFRPFMKVCEVGLFNTCLALLKALIEVSLKRKCLSNHFPHHFWDNYMCNSSFDSMCFADNRGSGIARNSVVSWSEVTKIWLNAANQGVAVDWFTIMGYRHFIFFFYFFQSGINPVFLFLHFRVTLTLVASSTLRGCTCFHSSGHLEDC